MPGRIMLSIKTKIIFVTFSLVITVTSALSYVWVSSQEDKLLQDMQTNLLNIRKMTQYSFQSFFQEISGDLQFLARTPGIKGTLRALSNNGTDPVTGFDLEHLKKQLQSGFKAYLETHPDYFQLRFLDTRNNGFEMVRVEQSKGRIFAVDEDKLQFKAHRDYYKEAVKKADGQIYFSAINLNQEFGQIEEPHKPTIRAAIPLYQDEKLHGVLIINVNTRLFLDKNIRDALHHKNQLHINTYVANPEGFWLLHPDNSHTFAFDLGNKYRIQNEFPELLDQVNTNSSDYRLSKLSDGRHAMLTRIFVNNANEIRFYYLLFIIPKDILQSETQKVYMELVITVLLTMALLLIPLMYLINRSFKPINQLVNVATEIAGGFYSGALPAAHDKESATLTLAFKNLREQVHQRERQLQESEKRNNIILENIPLGILLVDAHGKIRQINTQLEKMFGYFNNDLLDESLEVLIPEHQRESHKYKRNEFFNSHEERKMDDGRYFEARRRDGTMFPVNISLASVIFDQKEHVLATIIDISGKIDTEKRLWREANYDSLTDLPNRKLFYELLAQEQKIANRHKKTIWLMFLDLDGFKEINDTYGHDKGDILLIEVARRLKKTIRESDILARLGGDEFVILLTGIDNVADTELVANSIIDSIAHKYILDESEAFVSASIGIASYPNDADNTNDLMRFADQAMYQAKADGKNRLHYFTAALQDASQLRLQISNDIRHAIINHELVMHYQPIIDINSGEVYKAESLIRWNHPEKGMINPGGFIPIAEETGVIHDIGKWVLGEVIRQFENLSNKQLDKLQISINVSPLQLANDSNIYEIWMQQLGKSGLAGKNIIIEFTEGLLLKNEPMVSKRLLEFRDNNISIAIDDFGTGYSSLAYLKEFDIDYIKIDQSFIKNLKPSSSEESLVEAIIVMAHKLGMQVIAEGVETEQQLQMLKVIQCDFAQGFLFSKAVPFTGFINDFLHKNIYQ